MICKETRFYVAVNGCLVSTPAQFGCSKIVQRENSVCCMVTLQSGCAVQRCTGDVSSRWERPIFRSVSTENHLTDQNQILKKKHFKTLDFFDFQLLLAKMEYLVIHGR